MPKSTYTVKEVANLLGFSTNTVYKYLENGSIKAVRLGAEGRFRIPASEVNRLLQERGRSLQETPSSAPDPKKSLSIFDWFIGFLAIGLGFSQFTNPVYANAQQPLMEIAPYLNVVNILLFIGGALLLGFDTFMINKGHKHTALYLYIGVLSLVLAGIFLSQKSVSSVGYLSLSVVLILSAIKRINYRLQYLIFINLLFVLIGLGFLIWPGSSTFSILFRTGIVSRDVFAAVWFAFFCLLLFLSLKALKGSKYFMIITSFIAGTIALIYSAMSFTGGYWGRSIFGITLGTFSFVYPFASEFDTFKTKTKKEALVCFLWILGVFFIGSFMLRMAYRSFQTIILDEMNGRVELASEVTKNFMDRNTLTLSAFLSDNNLSKLLIEGSTADLDSELKQIYLSSNNSFVRMVVTDGNGKIVDTYPFYFQSQNVDISNRDYFSEPAKTGRVFVTGFIKPNSPGIEPSILISLPIIGTDGKFLGVILGSVDIFELQRQLGQIDHTGTSSFTVADSSGNYILNPDPQDTIIKAPSDSLVMKAVSGTSGSLVTYDYEGVLKLEAYKNVDDYNWGVVAAQSQSAAIRIYSLMGFATFLFFIITTIGSLTLVTFLRKNK